MRKNLRMASSRNEKLMKTLIHHGGSLGDTLLSLPSFEAIRKDSSSVHFIGGQDIAGFLNETGWVDTFSCAGSAVNASLYTSADVRARRFLESFDRAFVFTSQDDSPVAATIGAVIPRTRTITAVPPDSADIHVAAYRLAQHSGYERPLLPPTLTLSLPDDAQELLAEAGCVDGRLPVAIHPGSGGKKKCWPLEKYCELVARIAGDFRPIFLFFSGPAEEQSVKKQIDRFSRSRQDVTHIADGSLRTAASLLSRCSLYIGNDSGFSHLAAATGCRVLALFGPTNPAVWGPLGNVEIVSAGFPAPIDRIAVDTVFRVAASLLAPGTVLSR
jgi:heptosyltransferase-3